MTEQDCRKAFIKAAKEVIAVWPGYATHKFPAPDNRTDQCLQCDLKFSLKFLIETWRDHRAGRATDAEFTCSLVQWKVTHMQGAEFYDLGKPGEKYELDKRQKQLLKKRTECKFRNQ